MFFRKNNNKLKKEGEKHMTKRKSNSHYQEGILSNDEKITDVIKEKLHESMQESAMDINLFCRDGFVHMSGIVDVLTEKQYAEEIAVNTPGVIKVENKITVAMDGNFTDKHIEKEVMEKLADYDNDSVSGLGVKVNDGVVSLVGNVDTLMDANIAMNLASRIRGVKNVVNNTSIASSGKYDDTFISNKILQELSKTELSYRDIHRDVDGGIVRLSGYLDNPAEVELAKEIAMNVEGVRKVINKLHARKQE